MELITPPSTSDLKIEAFNKEEPKDKPDKVKQPEHSGYYRLPVDWEDYFYMDGTVNKLPSS